MSISTYTNPLEEVSQRSFIPTTHTTPRFKEIIDNVIIEFSKKTSQYYCPTFHSIETRNSEKHLVHKNCTHYTKSDIIGKTLFQFI